MRKMYMYMKPRVSQSCSSTSTARQQPSAGTKAVYSIPTQPNHVRFHESKLISPNRLYEMHQLMHRVMVGRVRRTVA